jgi:phosphomannomutase
MVGQEAQQLAHQWLSIDPFEHTRNEIETLLKNNEETELLRRLKERIAFGTAGLRARMAAGFACMNELIVIQTTQGLVEYIGKQKLIDDKNRGVVIGYDGRHKSKRFAQLTAIVFLSRGYNVYLFSELVCTPMVPFAVRELKTVAGIMITASHNPKQDNGYKLYWENGCQIIEPHDEGISKSINSNLQVWSEVAKMLPKDLGGDDTYWLPSHDHLKDPNKQIDTYFEKIRQYCHLHHENANRKEKITFTAMHGVGAPWVTRAFKVFNLPPYISVEEQNTPDAEFPTVQYPNPEEGKGALTIAIHTADKHGSRLILANDPDADRLAIAEKSGSDWRIFNGNEIALLLAHWVWSRYVQAENPSQEQRSKCVMINSTVSSKILRAMAKKEGFQFEETLTGFKWIGNRADDVIHQGLKFLFGYEVEIGFLVGDISLDKDGVRTAAVFAEMALYMYEIEKRSLAEQLEQLYKTYGYYLMKTRYFFCDSADRLRKIMGEVRTMGPNHGYPTKIPNLCDHSTTYFKIASIRDLTKGYDNSQPDNKPRLPVTPNSEMITFNFEDGSTCTLRNSGTEPKLKWYVEVNDQDKQVACKKLDVLTESVLQYLLRPSETGLVAPKDE